MARTMTTEALAAELGVDERTLRRWRKAGCPNSPGKGRAVLYDLDEVRAWMRTVGRTGERGGAPEERHGSAPATPARPPVDGQGDDEDEDEDLAQLDTATLRDRLLAARVQKEVAMAERHHLELEIRRGELLSKVDVIRGCTLAIEDAKAALEALPGKLAPRLAGKPYDDVYEVIEAEIGQTLNALASGLGAVSSASAER